MADGHYSPSVNSRQGCNRLTLQSQVLGREKTGWCRKLGGLLGERTLSGPERRFPRYGDRELRALIFPSNFPCNFSEDQSQELLKCCVASRKINKLGSASLPPEQKVQA